MERISPAEEPTGAAAPSTVTFLGSGDAFGSGGRFQTCILVRTAATSFLLDCGASSLIAMKKLAEQPASIDSILVTHLHGDHFGGIPFFLLEAQFSKRERPLQIAGPPGIEERVRAAMEALFPRSSETARRFPTDFLELHPRAAVTIGTLRVTAFPVVHFSGATPYALRVECGDRTIAYSGDTEWTEALVEAAAGADLFICEAYFFGKKVRYHLDYETLLQHRETLRCKRLVLTHMSPDMLDHVGDAVVQCAEDGTAIVL
jgi:ribonuclease BN (tRNA processing enzyme)